MIHLESDSRRSAVWNDWLKLEFTFHGDRWRHSLAWAAPSGWREAFHCLNIDDATEETVSSPVFQELFARRGVDGGGEIMLLGQLTAHVFSGSFRLAPDRPRLQVEVADRLRKPVALRRTGITYGPAAAGRFAFWPGQASAGGRGAALVCGDNGPAFAFVGAAGSGQAGALEATVPEFSKVETGQAGAERALFLGFETGAEPAGARTLRYAFDVLAVSPFPPEAGLSLDAAIATSVRAALLGDGSRP